MRVKDRGVEGRIGGWARQGMLQGYGRPQRLRIGSGLRVLWQGRMQCCDELVGIPKDLVRNESDEVESGNEAAHLVFLVDLDAEFLLEEVVHEMSTTASGHELDALAHVLY